MTTTTREARDRALALVEEVARFKTTDELTDDDRTADDVYETLDRLITRARKITAKDGGR